MGYLTAWKVLEDTVTDFRKKGVAVPVNVISDLRHARTLINILEADPTHLETSQKVEERLRSVECYLVSEGTKKFGKGYVKNLIKRLDEASIMAVEEEKKEARFISGVPRTQKWIRVKPSAELPINELKTLAEQLNLSFTVQDDGCLLVYGEDEPVKAFVKKMTGKYRLKAGE